MSFLYISSFYLPEFCSEITLGDVEFEYETKTSEKGFVDVINEVGGEDNDARKPLNMIEQNTHIDISISVRGCSKERHYIAATSCVLYLKFHSRGLSSLSKQTFSLVEHQNSILVSSLLENGVDILGALSHPFAEEFPTVDHFQRFSNFVANCLGDKGFTCAWTAMKQNGKTLMVTFCKSPLAKEHSSAKTEC